jgi:23S rRNA pseudouridine1911/1915/1917 synthase
MHTFRKKRESRTFFTVKEEVNLYDFIFSKMGGMSKTSVKNLLTKGQVKVNEKIATQYNLPLKPNDKIEINFVKASVGLTSSKLSLVYEDDNFIVINKSAGLLSVATDKQESATAFRIVMNHIKKLDKNNRIYIIHRLDRDISGLLIFAKDRDTQMIIQKNWHKLVKKNNYLALVEGTIEKENGTIHSWLVEEPKSKKVYSFDYDNGGLESFTDYKVIKHFPKNTLMEINPRTGRKNQIRVHMQSIGHPIVGDKKYGGSKSPIGRVGLHAYQLEFIHPITKKLISLEAAIPEKIASFRG